MLIVNRQFQEAIEYFRQVKQMDSTDNLASIFIDRCNILY